MSSFFTKTRIVGACCGNNCGPQPGCQWGPVEFMDRFASQEMREALEGHVYEAWCRSRETDYLERTGAFCTALASATAKVVRNGKFPIVIGGDHSCAIGTWRGIVHYGVEAGHNPGRIGMVWIDAHLDSHTPETSESGAIHGMPVAALCGHGSPYLVSETIDPAYTVIVGARSFESGEVAFTERHGIKVIYMDQIVQRGKDLYDSWTTSGSLNCGTRVEAMLQAQREAIQEAIAHASSCQNGFGISVDLDGFDPAAAPSVSCPEEGGLQPHQFIEAVQRAITVDNVAGWRGFEIVEFNPTISPDGVGAFGEAYDHAVLINSDNETTGQAIHSIVYNVAKHRYVMMAARELGLGNVV